MKTASQLHARLHHRLRHLSALAWLLLSQAGTTTWAGDLPPAPRSAAEVSQYYSLHLDWVLNHYAVGKIVPTIV